MSKDFEEKFLFYCKSENLEVNQSQIKVIKRLQDFFNQNFTFNFFRLFSKKKSKKAFYLHGGVGVGKTMILNFFFDLISQDKKRLHFNEFMLEFHDFVHTRKDKNQENWKHRIKVMKRRNLYNESDIHLFIEMELLERNA